MTEWLPGGTTPVLPCPGAQAMSNVIESTVTVTVVAPACVQVSGALVMPLVIVQRSSKYWTGCAASDPAPPPVPVAEPSTFLPEPPQPTTTLNATSNPINATRSIRPPMTGRI